MARILYGVMGDARGHLSRALTVAQQMPHHEFLFLGGGLVHDLKLKGYTVEDIPVPGTFYKNNRIDVPSTVVNALRVFAGKSSVIKRIGAIIDSFDPDLILTDYEYFTPLAARSKGRVCVSLDHQHIMTHCLYQAPSMERLSRAMTEFSVRRLYSNANYFLIVSFFDLPVIDRQTTQVLPAIVRNAVKDYAPVEADHALVYLTSPTFHKLLPILEQINTRFLIYGFGDLQSRGNLVFRPFSTEGFLEDLASCRYAIVNGGHNVISEALYLGKPIFSFPIRQVYEQFMNAYFLAQSMYGDFSIGEPSRNVLETFESRLDVFKQGIKKNFKIGNEIVTGAIEQFIGRSM